MYYTIIIYLLSFISPVHTLKCFTNFNCSTSLKFDEPLPSAVLWPSACRLVARGTDVTTCAAYIYVDYMSQLSSVRFQPIEKSKEHTLSDPIKRLLHSTNEIFTWFSLQVSLREVKPFFISASIYCRSRDLCLESEVRLILLRLNTMKNRSPNVFQTFKTLPIESSSTLTTHPTLSCFNYEKNQTIKCIPEDSHTCYVRYINDEGIDNGCRKNESLLYFKIGYTQLWINNFENIHYYWDLVCNQTNCDTPESYTNMSLLALTYITPSYTSEMFTTLVKSIINQVIMKKLSQSLTTKNNTAVTNLFETTTTTTTTANTLPQNVTITTNLSETAVTEISHQGSTTTSQSNQKQFSLKFCITILLLMILLFH